MKDKRIYYNELFDCYYKLLTEKEQSYFKMYYEEDLSLQEIADNNKVSRTAIQKSLKNIILKLEDYETKLKINEKNNVLKNIMNTENIKIIKERIQKIFE